MDKLYITRVWLDGHHLFAMTEGGKTAHYDLSTMRGFRHATQLQLANFVVNGKDIHWPDHHLCALTDTEDSAVYRPAPQSHDCVAEPLAPTGFHDNK